MSFRTFFAVLVLLLGGGGAAHAQYGVLIERGLGAGVGTTIADNTTTYSASAGYVAVPWLEAGLVATRTRSGDGRIDQVQRSIGPYLTAYPLRQGDGSRIGLFATLSASIGDRSGDVADTIERRGGSVSNRSGSIGIGAFRSIDLGERRSVSPIVALTYVRATEASTLDGETESTTAGTAVLSVEARFLVDPTTFPRISLTPRASIGDVVTGGLSAAVLLGGE